MIKVQRAFSAQFANDLKEDRKEAVWILVDDWLDDIRMAAVIDGSLQFKAATAKGDL